LLFFSPLGSFISKLCGFNAGGGAGIIAGRLGASPAMGTAEDAIAKLPISEAALQQLTASAAVAFAVTYLVGVITTIFTLSKVAPWLMRVDLKSTCRKLEAELGIQDKEPGVFSAYQHFVAQSYSLPESLDGKTAAALEQAFSPARVFVARVANSHGPADAGPETVLHRGDKVAPTGRNEILASAESPLFMYEIDDPDLLDIPVVTVDLVLARRDLDLRTLAGVVEVLGSEAPTRGVFVMEISRGGEKLPIGTGLVLERGDTLRLVGAKKTCRAWRHG
jgi:putative transport protein